MVLLPGTEIRIDYIQINQGVFFGMVLCASEHIVDGSLGLATAKCPPTKTAMFLLSINDESSHADYKKLHYKSHIVTIRQTKLYSFLLSHLFYR